MGLTIHWGVKYAKRSPSSPQGVLEQIRQRALDMPFDGVGEMVHLKGAECVFERGLDDPLGWLKIQAGVHVRDPRHTNYSYSVEAAEIIGFEIEVAPGSEPMNFTLCRYPGTVETGDGRRFRTRLAGWSGHSFCKTQYASDPSCGGVPNFLRAHVSVVRLLEFAQTLDGLKVSINDEGKYGTSYYTDDWHVPKPVYYDHPPKHDLAALVTEVGEWNAMIAAGFGALKDLVGDGIVAPIADYSNFEHLEMEGLKNMPPERLDNFLKACKEVSRRATA